MSFLKQPNAISNDSDWSYTLTSEPTLFANRGFTGHEFLPEFNLYNMNGRLYDPVVGRFLNPDNLIQDPANTQSYNRYSYCLNNPLKYTDPDGQVPLIPLIGSWVGNYVIGGLDRWINQKMSFKNAFLNAPFVGGVNYSPSDGTFSNSQVDAFNSAKGAGKMSDQLDGFIASQYGAAERSWKASSNGDIMTYSGEIGETYSGLWGDLDIESKQSTYFKNINDGLYFMWDRSISANREINALVTDKGILVLPFYKNTIKRAYFDYVNYPNHWTATLGGIEFNIQTTAHTHILYTRNGIGISKDDVKNMDYFKQNSQLIIYNNFLYKANDNYSYQFLRLIK
jgi:RHS repeat-associated protein